MDGLSAFCCGKWACLRAAKKQDSRQRVAQVASTPVKEFNPHAARNGRLSELQPGPGQLGLRKGLVPPGLRKGRLVFTAPGSFGLCVASSYIYKARHSLM